MAANDLPKKPTDRPAPPPPVTVFVGTLPWLAAWLGSYVLHSAIASFLLYHALCATSAFLFRRKYGPRSGKPFHHRHWLLLGAGCIAVCLLTYSLAGLLGALADPGRVEQGLRAQHIPFDRTSYICLFCYFGIVNPIVEEYFWRGTIYAALRRKHLRIRTCSNIDAFLFGSWHWLIVRLFFPPVESLILTFGIIVVGELFCRFYERTRSLPALCLLHSLGADVPILVILWFTVLSRSQ
jgi:membrane protease YdiL (CAAX protease family)